MRSAKRVATSSSPVSPVQRRWAMAAWIRWPAQYSSWLSVRFVQRRPFPSFWTRLAGSDAPYSAAHLTQAAGAVQLVVVGEVRPAASLPQLLVVDGVEIAALVLSGGDPSGDAALQLQQLRVAGAADLVGGRLEPLVQVGVGEDQRGDLAVLGAGGDVQVAQHAGVLEPLVAAVDGAGAVGLEPLAPEAAGDGGGPCGQRALRGGRRGHHRRRQGAGGRGRGHGQAPARARRIIDQEIAGKEPDRRPPSRPTLVFSAGATVSGASAEFAA